MRVPAALLVLVLVAGCAGSGAGIEASLDPAAGGRPATTMTVVAATETTTTAAPAATTTTTTATATTAAATTRAPRAPIVLGFAGDTAFTHGLEQRDPLGAVTALLSTADLMVVNLETAVADPGVGTAVDKDFVFRSPPASLDLLVAAGVDVAALANNHVLDHGVPALEQTLAELDARGLHRVGAGLDPAEAYRPLVLPVGGWTVGLVGLSRVPCDWSASGVNTRPQVAWACPAFLDLADAAVTEAVARADVTVVMVHGGDEGEPCPSPHMAELVTRWAGLGADLVVDGHPHVVQGIEQVGGTLVVHSTGNFAFPSARGLSADSAVFLVEVSEAGLSLRVEPVAITGGVVTPAEGERRQATIERIEAHSFGWAVDPDGTARPEAGAGGACGEVSDPARASGA